MREEITEKKKQIA